MSEAQRESISAGMDGELSREEIRFLLRRMASDADLPDAWSRYHVARDGVRGEVLAPVSRDFASRVMAAIEAEAEQAAVPVAAPRRRWLHWSAGGAIAASVAVAALMLSQPTGNGPAGVSPVAQGVPASSEGVSNPIADAVREPAQAPAVPQWLSGNMASQFTQKAAFEGPGDDGGLYLPRSTPYQINRTRAAQAPESNGYMLLVRPDGSRYVAPIAAPQAR
ncbi:sigma-E factor negative regulatory protein [Luteibacter sp. PPL552]